MKVFKNGGSPAMDDGIKRQLELMPVACALGLVVWELFVVLKKGVSSRVALCDGDD